MLSCLPILKAVQIVQPQADILKGKLCSIQYPLTKYNMNEKFNIYGLKSQLGL